MIWTVFRVSLSRLLHNRVELLLAFVVPIAFFSIFAMIFGKGMGSTQTPKIKAVVIDSVQTAESQQAVERIREIPCLRMLDEHDKTRPINEQQATDLVRRGMVTLAIVVHQRVVAPVLPAGAEARSMPGVLTAELLSDASDQVASQVVTGLVTQALMPNHIDLGRVDPNPLMVPDGVRQASSMEPISAPLVHVVDVLAADKANPVISMYAAGIAVMFLLFGASSGGGSLLEEQENHTLERLLTTRITMDQLLLGKWSYQTMLGVVQVGVMFLWGWLVFGIDLWRHFDGFLLMTLVTAGAAASFGLFLATLCRTRGQLNGISVILILTMSALGGSMVPRYLMSETLREAGLFTFNAWALDGFDKVFWRELPVAELWPQMCVLMLSGAAFLVVSRLLALRWESA